MKKFFLFRKEEVNVSSVSASDTGAGLSVLAIPADSLAFLSAGIGEVIMYLNGTSKYEESDLTDGESFEKTSVIIPCEEGKEVSLMESIIAYISSDVVEDPIMRFDNVSMSSTFEEVSFDSLLNSRVRINPVKRVTGASSTQTFLGTSGTIGVDVTSTTIAGIDFGTAENKPELDFNHEGLSSIANTHQVNSWANDGTGGAAYDIGSNVGTPSKYDGGGIAKDAIGKDYVTFLDADHFIVPTYTASGPYVAYMVFSYGNVVPNVSPIYGSADTKTFGPFIQTYKTDASGNVNALGSHVPNTVMVRHKDRQGLPGFATTSNTDYSTVAYKFPQIGTAASNFQEHLNVFVIRRDLKNNVFAYNRDGDLVGFIPTVTGSVTNATNYRTDGDLIIERLGTVGNLTTNSFNGNLARFGVIDHDIGSAACSTLATDLFNLYSI